MIRGTAIWKPHGVDPVVAVRLELRLELRQLRPLREVEVLPAALARRRRSRCGRPRPARGKAARRPRHVDDADGLVKPVENQNVGAQGRREGGRGGLTPPAKPARLAAGGGKCAGWAGSWCIRPQPQGAPAGALGPGAGANGAGGRSGVTTSGVRPAGLRFPGIRPSRPGFDGSRRHATVPRPWRAPNCTGARSGKATIPERSGAVAAAPLSRPARHRPALGAAPRRCPQVVAADRAHVPGLAPGTVAVAIDRPRAGLSFTCPRRSAPQVRQRPCRSRQLTLRRRSTHSTARMMSSKGTRNPTHPAK